MHDLVIRGATVVDGLGKAPGAADVAVDAGRISAVGRVTGAAEQTVDAAGLVLSPGIIDLHTHYDAQVTWDPTLSPSPGLGVTTTVMGNCGFGSVDRGRIEVGAFADLMLFDYDTVGISPARQVADLPGGGRRTVREATGLAGVFVNGIKVHDGEGYADHAKGPGQVLDSFARSSALG